MVAFSPEDSLILQNLGFHISVIMVCHTESLHTPWKQSVIQGSLISQGIPIFLGKWGPCRVPIFLVIQGPRVSISWALCMWGPGISVLEGPHPFSHDIVIRLPNFLVASYPPPRTINKTQLPEKKKASQKLYAWHATANLIPGLHYLNYFTWILFD